MTALAFPLAAAPAPEAAEAGRKLFAGPVDFLKSVADMDGLPPADRTEIAFAGRSNVGKSSLINALAGRKGLARASTTPGRTQTINFYALGSTRYMVDLPGYGYAKAPKAAVAEWQALMRAYLAGRARLRRVFVLLDARRGLTRPDEEMLALLDGAAVTFQAVLTKTDKVKPAESARALDAVRGVLAAHPAAFPELVATSTVTGEGLPALRAGVAALE